MEWLRSNLSARVWFATLIVWLTTGNAAFVHEYSVAHVWCAEHGEVVELSARASTASSEDGPTLSAGAQDNDHHDHGCALPGVPATTDDLPVLCAPPAPQAIAWPLVAVVLSLAPRPPPLAYAPKTSPPALV